MSTATYDLPPAYRTLQPEHSVPLISSRPAEQSISHSPSRPPSTHNHRVPTRTIIKSARYPRVAVLLGVPKKWFVPLLLCRSTSVLFALWWAGTMALNIRVLTKLSGGQRMGGEGGAVKQASSAGGRFNVRILSAQLGLAFLWVSINGFIDMGDVLFVFSPMFNVHKASRELYTSLRASANVLHIQASTAAYVSHLFAASLMSRWLQHYSPLAVLVRLCSLNVLLSYGSLQLFSYMGTLTVDPSASLEKNLDKLSENLPAWMFVSVALLTGYFLTQQDISVESGEDDRRRRLILRMKCFKALSATSFLSLVALVVVIRTKDRELWLDWNDLTKRYRDLSHLLLHTSWQSSHNEL